MDMPILLKKFKIGLFQAYFLQNLGQELEI